METDLNPSRFLPALQAFLDHRREAWATRPGAVHVVPRRPIGRSGMPSNGAGSLIVADRQSLQVAWPGGGTDVAEDEVLVIPADRPYRLTYDERRRRYPVLGIYALDDDIVCHRRNLPPEREPEAALRFAAGSGQLLEALLATVIAGDAIAEPEVCYAAILGRAVADILSLASVAAARPLRESRGGKAIAVRCREYLRTHLADPQLDVPAIAAALGYEARWLGRRYLAITGETIRERLAFVRIQHARELLRQRDLAIAEVARCCGFASASAFSRTFARIEGNPPQKFRKYGHLEEG